MERLNKHWGQRQSFPSPFPTVLPSFLSFVVPFPLPPRLYLLNPASGVGSASCAAVWMPFSGAF